MSKTRVAIDGNRSADETRCSKLGPFVLQTDFAQIPTRSISYRRVGRRVGCAGMIGHRGGFFQRTAIFKYAVMPVARTLSPATRESHQPDAASISGLARLHDQSAPEISERSSRAPAFVPSVRNDHQYPLERTTKRNNEEKDSAGARPLEILSVADANRQVLRLATLAQRQPSIDERCGLPSPSPPSVAITLLPRAHTLL